MNNPYSLWTGNKVLDDMRSKAAASATGVITVSIEELNRIIEPRHRFRETHCSQCGASFGAGDHGYSHCRNHLTASGIPKAALCYFRDGDQWCCVLGDFKNLQESPAGFGDTEDDAYKDLLGQITCETCQGDGRVPIRDKDVVDRGTKWHRSCERDDEMECPDCDGSGICR